MKIHLGLRLRTRMCSWSVEEGCVFTRGGLGEKGWGSKGSCQNSHRDKNQKKNVEKQLAKLMTTVLSKSWQGRAFFCLLEMIALKVFFFFFFSQDYQRKGIVLSFFSSGVLILSFPFSHSPCSNYSCQAL